VKCLPKKERCTVFHRNWNEDALGLGVYREGTSPQTYKGSRMCREWNEQKRKGTLAIYPRGQVITHLHSAASDMMMRIRIVWLNDCMSRSIHRKSVWSGLCLEICRIAWASAPKSSVASRDIRGLDQIKRGLLQCAMISGLTANLCMHTGKSFFMIVECTKES